MATDPGPPIEPAPQPTKNTIVRTVNSTLIVLAIICPLSTVLTSYIVTTPGVVGPTDKAETHADAATKETQTLTGPIVPLDPFLVNLADIDSRRYLKVTISLEMMPRNEVKKESHEKKGGGGSATDVDNNLPIIRNTIINILSSQTFESVRSIEGKDEIRRSIIEHVNESLGGPKVKGCFFTDFTAQ